MIGIGVVDSMSMEINQVFKSREGEDGDWVLSGWFILFPTRTVVLTKMSFHRYLVLIQCIILVEPQAI
jgi:hypothetical protein